MSETTERATGATDVRELMARAFYEGRIAHIDQINGHRDAPPWEHALHGLSVNSGYKEAHRAAVDAQLAALAEHGYRIVPAEVLTEAEREAITAVCDDLESCYRSGSLGDALTAHIATLRALVVRGGG